MHVVPPEHVPLKGTNYHVVDPASGKNWFMIWVRVEDSAPIMYTVSGRRASTSLPLVIRGIGPRPMGRLADGRCGPAQLCYGWGLNRYKEEIERLEQNDSEPVAQRWMDSRFGGTPSLSADSATTLIEECANLGLYFHPGAA